MPSSMQQDFSQLGLIVKHDDCRIEANSAAVGFGDSPRTKNIEEGSQQRSSVCKLSIQTEYPYKIIEADRKWLELFGFQDKEIAGRALRMCQGPDTNVKTIQSLLSGNQKVGVPLTLYTKCGEPVSFSAVAGEMETNGDGCRFCPLFLDLAAAAGAHPSTEEEAAEIPTVVLDADEPWEVLHVNSAFACKFGSSADEIRREGVWSVLASCADGLRWRNTLKNAKDGKTSRCLQTVKSAEGIEWQASFQASPHKFSELREGSSRSEVIEIAVTCTDADTENAGVDLPQSQAVLITRARSAPVFNNSVQVHLKAMAKVRRAAS